jgi:threonine dehydratase
MRVAAQHCSGCRNFTRWRAPVGQSFLRYEEQTSLVPTGTRHFSDKRTRSTQQERINRDGLVKCFPDAFDYIQDILNAKVYDVCKTTELTYAPKLSQKTGNRVLLKREDQQPVHSFKLRGAYNRIRQMSEEERSCGIVACSAGNHAQGVAFSAAKLGISAKIFMPKITPSIKVDAVHAIAGEFTEVILEGYNYDEAYAAMLKCKEEEGRVLVHPFNDPQVIAGQGTIGQEIISQTTSETVDAVFGCVGGGGLVSGMGLFVKAVKPSIKVIGVEAEDSAAMTESFRAGELVTLPSVGLFADGASVRVVGDETFRISQMVVDEMMTVTTDEICAAIKDTFLDTRVVLEPAGALAIAGLTKYSALMERKGQTLVAVASGANMDFDRLRFVSERADTSETLIAVQIPERPGSFIEMYRHIYPRNVTEFSYRISDDPASIYMSFQADSNDDRDIVLRSLNSSGFRPRHLGDNELAKTHGRHLVGGRAPARMTEDEVLFRFTFPEKPGVILQFLESLPTTCNISLFHYRSHGADQARVLVAFQVPAKNRMQLREYLQDLEKQGFTWVEETENEIYGNFLLEPVAANIAGRSRPRQPPPLTLTTVDGL